MMAEAGLRREALERVGRAERTVIDLAELHRAQYRTMVRVAALLVTDVAAAEEIVQDAFVKLHLGWARVHDPDRTVAYLRSAVLNGARSWLRRRRVLARYVPAVPADTESAESAALLRADRRAVVTAVSTLSVRQRECVVLRYYLGLEEGEIAESLGISRGSVKTHTHRALATLGQRLETCK
jgi:RNA polymerase sigma-70 factor (sigma-E family)